MSLSPVAFIAPNYRDYKGWWLKFYSAGTTTPKTIILNSGGTTSSASKLQLNQDGFITSSGGTIVVPYITGAYDAYLFPTAIEADVNNTAQAVRVADALTNELASSVVVFDNVAEMKAASLNIGQAAMCKRYYANGDLVDGLVYEIQSSSAVDGFVDHAITNGNVAILIESETLNVSQAGAKGNDLSNDRNAIQACVDRLNTAGGGVVTFDHVTYLIPASSFSSGIRLKSNVKLDLGKATLKAVTSNSTDYRLIWIQEASNCGVYGGKIEGDRLSNTQTVGEQGHCIYIILDCFDIKIENVELTEAFGDGVYIGRDSARVSVTGCHIYNNRRNNISIVACDNVIVTDNEIHDARGTSPQTGIDVEPNATNSLSSNIIIANNNIYNNEEDGISFPAPPPVALVDYALIDGNIIYGNGRYGVATGYVKKLIVSNNVIRDNGSLGFIENNTLGEIISITDNLIVNNGGTGVLGFTSNAKVTGNTITNCTGEGVDWRNGNNVSINDNTISDCSENGIIVNRVFSSSIANNTIRNIQKNGIYLTGLTGASTNFSRKLSVVGNSIFSVGLLTDDTYSGILADEFASTSIIAGNVIERASSGNQPQHAINASSSDMEVVANFTLTGAKAGNSQVVVGSLTTPSFLNNPSIVPFLYTTRNYTSAGTFNSAGAGSPEGALSAGVGSLYFRTDGGAGTSLYVKESGSSNTGWVAK